MSIAQPAAPAVARRALRGRHGDRQPEDRHGRRHDYTAADHRTDIHPRDRARRRHAQRDRRAHGPVAAIRVERPVGRP